MWKVHGGRVLRVAAVAALSLSVTVQDAAAQDADARDGAARAAVTGELWVEGGSTVRSWECAATRFSVDLTASRADLSVGTAQSAVDTLRLAVPTMALDCEDDTMNRHMRDALGAEDHEAIRFDLESYDVVQMDEGARALLRGSLSIRGSARPVTIAADLRDEAGGLRVRGAHTIDMTQFGVRPPRLMFGALRVHDEVEVHFDLLVSPDADAAARYRDLTPSLVRSLPRPHPNEDT